MKYITPLLFLILLFGCAGNQQNQANVDLIQKYVDAVEAQDYETMESLLAEDYVGFGPSHNDSTNRENALASWKSNVENLYESIQYNRSRIIGVTIPDGPNRGEWVSNWAELTIRYKDGRGPVTIWANTSYRIENGLIDRSYTFYNEADVLEQLGYVFINPEDL